MPMTVHSHSSGILLFRSSRHLEAALAALRREYPGCPVYVVSQPGTEELLDTQGVGTERRFIYSAERFFSPLRFLRSDTGRELRRQRARGVFRRVAVLWPDSSGGTHINVSLTALCLSPGGVLAITPEGRVISSGALKNLLDLISPIGRGLARRCRRFYDRVAALHQSWRRVWAAVEGPELEPRICHSHFLVQYWLNRRLPTLSHHLKGLVLDVGAGTGYGARFLRLDRTRYLPTDVPTGRDAGDRAISRIGNKPALFCSGYEIPLRVASVDAVMALSVLEHVREPGRIAREAARVLKPGGNLLVVTPFCFPLHGEPDDFWRWTHRGLELELQRAGFTNCRTQNIGDTVSALSLNLQLYLKYQLGMSGPALIRFLVATLMPLLLVVQTALNAVAVLCTGLDAECKLPICVAILAQKPHQSSILLNGTTES